MPVMSGLLLLMAGLSVLMIGVYGDRDKLSDKEIKEKLELLTNEVLQLKKDVREIRGRETKGEETGKEDSKLRILSVSRVSLSNQKVLFTIRYQQPDTTFSLKPIWRKFENYMYTLIPETISNEIPNLPSGVRETSIVTSPKNGTHLMLLVGSSKQWLSLFLNNESENDENETDIEIPLLDITPKGDVVYDLGRNATMDIAFPRENVRQDPGSMMDNSVFGASYVFVKPHDMKLITDHDSRAELLNPGKENKFLDKVEMTVYINTSIIPYSGVMNLYSGVTREKGVVKRVENHKEIVLRPSTQTEPFPEGKIYHKTFPLPNSRENENGEIVSQCSYGKVCQKYCQFFGKDLTSLELFKTVNGKTTPEHIEIFDTASLSYQKAGTFELLPMEGDSFPVTYTCKAGNVEGQTAEWNEVVVFGYDVKILTNESSFEIFDNGTGKIVCTARGIPLPKVTIQCQYDEAKPDVLYQTDDVISVMATCSDLKKWSLITCSAENDFNSDIYYDMSGSSYW